MPEMKHNFTSGKMNKDLDERIVPRGQYRDAMNVQVATTEGSDVGTVQNILGNMEMIGQTFIPPNSICVGSVADEKDDSLYWFVYNTQETRRVGQQQSSAYFTRNFIIKYKDGVVTPVFVDVTGDVLSFNPNNIITGINILDGMLFWTDNFSEPKKINIQRSIDGTDASGVIHTKLVNEAASYGIGQTEIDVSEEHVTVLKKRPKSPLSITPRTGRDPDKFYSGIVKIVVDPQGTPNLSSFYSNGWDFPNRDDDIYDFSGLEVGNDDNDTFSLRMGWSGGNNLDAAAVSGAGVEVDNGQYWKMEWDIGTKVVLKAYSEANGIRPSIPITDHVIKGYIADWPSSTQASGTWNKFDNDPGDHFCQVKVKITSIDGFPDPAISPSNHRLYIIDKFDETEKLFEFKFPRFSYRYRYEDGEYSAFAPWTEVVFSPGSFDYHPRKGYNLGMVNRLTEIDVSDFVTSDMPNDVVSIDILYKDDRSPNVYIVDTLRPNDELLFDDDGAYRTHGATQNWWTLSDGRGKYTVTDEIVKSTVPSNQMLRPYDNVPREALAQDVTGNRVVYGNYLQNYDLLAGNTNKNYNPRFKRSLSVWSVNTPTRAVKSIKSLREYQLGVVFVDMYGRETPVLSNTSGTIKVEKDRASKHNRIRAGLKGQDFPYNMKFFKFFIKETAGEYYNMAMDRWYEAEDGNIWLAFPSTDRNKIDIDTFLVLKKGTDSNELVTQAARYKVLAIENQAPDFIKTRRYQIEEQKHYIDTAGVNTLDLFGVGIEGAPTLGLDYFEMNYVQFHGSSGGALHEIYSGSEQAVLWVEFGMFGDDEVSDRYRITEISCNYEPQDPNSTTANSKYFVQVSKPFGEDTNFITDSPTGLASTRVNDGAIVRIYKYVVENSPKFDGRFFVKIYKDDIFQQKIQKSFLKGVEYRVTQRKKVYSTTPNHHSHLLNRKTGIGLNDINSVNAPGGTGGITNHCNENKVWGPMPQSCQFLMDQRLAPYHQWIGNTPFYYPHGAYSIPWPSGYTEFASWAVYFRKYGRKVQGEFYGERGSHYKKISCWGSGLDSAPALIFQCDTSHPHGGSTYNDDPENPSGTDWQLFPFPDVNHQQGVDEMHHLTGPHLIESEIIAGTCWPSMFAGQTPGGISTYHPMRPGCHGYNLNTDSLSSVSHVDEKTREWEVWFVDGGPFVGHRHNDNLYSSYISSLYQEISTGCATGHGTGLPYNIPAWHTQYSRGIKTFSNHWKMDLGFGGLTNDDIRGEDPGVGLADLFGHGVNNVPGDWVYENFYSLADWMPPTDPLIDPNPAYQDFDDKKWADKLHPGHRLRWREDPTGGGGQATIYDITATVGSQNRLRYSVGNNCVNNDMCNAGSNHNTYHGWWSGIATANCTYGMVHRGDHWDHFTRNHLNAGGGFTCNFTKTWEFSKISPALTWNPYSTDGESWIQSGLDIQLTQSKITATSDYVTTTNIYEPIIIYVGTIRGTCSTTGISRDIHPGMALYQGTNANGGSGTLEDLPGAGANTAPFMYDPSNSHNDLLVVVDVADGPVAGIDGPSDQNHDGYWVKLVGHRNPLSLTDLSLQGESGGTWRFVQPKMNGLSPNAADTISAHSGLIGAVGYHLDFVEEVEPEEILSENPAIFETEPKEIKDLDIYYEATGYLPITLDESTIGTAIPLNSIVIHQHLPAPTRVTGTTGGDTIIIDSTISTGGINNGDYLKIETPTGLRFSVTVVSAPLSGVNEIQIDSLLYNAWFELPWHNCYSFGNGVESNRIRDNFNLPYISNGVKVSTTLEEEYKEEHRKYGLIYSGIYNSISGVNNLNQFIQAEKITKDINPIYGSIQKLHSRDTDLVTLCEDKILKILANKDALFNADGSSNVTATENVLGQTIPFDGEYGISTNPESFASEAYRVYFTDKIRGAVMRLSKDGLTPISDHGMRQWFKENLKLGDALIGSHDDKKDQYNITIENGDQPYTLTFKETVKGWVSFKSFIPENAISMANDYYTFQSGRLYKHHLEEYQGQTVDRNTFYGQFTSSSLNVILNQNPGLVKAFNTLNYEGSQAKIDRFEERTIDGVNYSDQEYYNMTAKDGWYVQNITTNKQDGYITEFIEKEGEWFNYMRGIVDTDLSNTPSTAEFSFQGIGMARTQRAPSTWDCGPNFQCIQVDEGDPGYPAIYTSLSSCRVSCQPLLQSRWACRTVGQPCIEVLPADPDWVNLIAPHNQSQILCEDECSVFGCMDSGNMGQAWWSQYYPSTVWGSNYPSTQALNYYPGATQESGNCIWPSWDCVQGVCIERDLAWVINCSGGSPPYTACFGQFGSLTDCQASGCVQPPIASWDCVNGSCVDPGTGNGTYSSLAACQAVCQLPCDPAWEPTTTIVDDTGSCINPNYDGAANVSGIIPNWQPGDSWIWSVVMVPSVPGQVWTDSTTYTTPNISFILQGLPYGPPPSGTLNLLELVQPGDYEVTIIHYKSTPAGVPPGECGYPKTFSIGCSPPVIDIAWTGCCDATALEYSQLGPNGMTCIIDPLCTCCMDPVFPNLPCGHPSGSSPNLVCTYPSCFVAGTKITMENNSYKNIEDVKTGDVVKSWNEKTGNIDNNKVVMSRQQTGSNMVKLSFGDIEIKNTFDHPYYVENKGWCSYKPDSTATKYNIGEIKQLEIGDTCYKHNNGLLEKIVLTKATEDLGEVQTYIFTVGKDNTFFANDMLVHNKLINGNGNGATITNNGNGNRGGYGY